MKKSLLLGLLGLAATALSTFGQGTIILDNYNTSGPYVIFGNGPDAGARVTSAFPGPWTVGFYYVLGNVTIGADPNPVPMGDPSTFAGGLTLATGPGSTAGLNDFGAPPFIPGSFLAGSDFVVPGTSAGGGNVVTMELAVYNGSTYDTSTQRSHGDPFQITTTANTTLQAAQVGKVMPEFKLYIDPEPSVFALSSVSFAVLMLIRRKKGVVS